MNREIAQLMFRIGRGLGIIVLLLLCGQFSYGQVSDGNYKLVNRQSGQVLAPLNNATTNGTPLVQMPYDGSTGRQWTLTSLGNGQYKVIGLASGRSINVVNNTSNPGAVVQLWTYSDVGADKVTLVDQGNGYYSLVFVRTGLALQVATNSSTSMPNGAFALGQAIIQATYSATTLNAQWKLIAPTEGSTSGVPFSMVALPDTQKEVAGTVGSTPQMFYNQINWINSQRTSLNIQYVMGVGDIVDNGSLANQWTVARTGYYALDTTVPYGVAPGNHDYDQVDGTALTLNNYNGSFGVSHFIDKAYYGGHFGSENNNHYDLISSSGLDFIIVYLNWHLAPGAGTISWSDSVAEMVWVNNVLKAYSNRRAIIVSHELIGTGGAWTATGQLLYDMVKDNTNIALMLCGHYAPCNEVFRQDTYNGNTITTMLLDYQDAASPDLGGNSILRYLVFHPRENLITSQTYNVTANTWMYGFSIPYQMHGAPAGLTTAQPYYMIVNKNSALAMDLIGASTADGAPVNQKIYSYGSAEQLWALVPSENMDHFKIISYVTGKALSVENDSLDGNAQIIQRAYTKNNPAQQWDLVDAGNGWYAIRNVNSGKVLDDKLAGTADGTIIWQRAANGSAAQQWRLQPWGKYYIRTSSGNYISTQDQATVNHTAVVQNAGLNNLAFQWGFSMDTEGYLGVVLQARTSVRLQVAGASTAAGANCNILYGSTATVRVKPLTNGWTKFYWTHDDLSWEIPGDSIDVNTVLEQNIDNANAPEQQFLLQRAP